MIRFIQIAIPIVKLTLLMTAICIISSFKQPPGKGKWIRLFNGKDLAGWETYLGPRYDTTAGDFKGPRFGLNNDPDSVFTVVMIDGQPAIRTSGQHFGCIATREEFSNYHLQVEFKWGEQRYPPRQHAKRDAGVLYHSHGPHGVGWFFWMAAQEFQVQEGDCGDYWSVLSDVDATVIMNTDSTYTYHPTGEIKFFGPHGGLRGHVIRSHDAEKPNGEWNRLDLYTVGGTSYHVVNGQLVNVLQHSQQIVDGKLVPLTGGKIQLQSEGSEIFYRNVQLEPIDKLPDVNHKF